MKSTPKYRREFFRSFTPEDRQRALQQFAPERSVATLEGSFEEVNAKQLGPISRLTLLNPPDVRLGDTVQYTPAEDAKIFRESCAGKVVRVGKPYDSGVFNVDLEVAIECRHCYDHDLGHGNHGECCHCSPEQKRNLYAPTHQIKTVPCEGCEVVFRPRTHAYRIAEIKALFADGKNPNGVYLYGKTKEKVAALDARSDGSWNVRLPHPLGSTFFAADDKRWRYRHLGAMSAALELVNTYLFGAPVEVGDALTEHINQGDRDCEVIEVKRTRYRIEFDMPNCTQQGWRTGTRIGDTLYYTIEAR